jgi:hypothetical protein
MAYLSNTTTTVDAILTTKGRELLAKGKGFQITKFALADDEVDYSLYTTSHPLGSNFYGTIIENMPLVEASPDETQVMRYKLVTLPRGTKQIPIITLGFDNITLTAGQANAIPIRPTTTQALNGAGFGYTAVLFNSDAAVLVGTGLPSNANATTPAFFGDSGTSNAVFSTGVEFTLTPKDVAVQVTTQLTIIGNQTGGTITIPVVVKPKPTT